MEILKHAKSLFPQLEKDYKYLHAHAETGFDLSETFAFVEKRLTQLGCNPRKCGKSGITAVIGDEKKGKCLLLRTDMDALPICERSGLDFACNNGNMHACGHDAHTAMLLGAAQLLKTHESVLNGCVKLMFQPAEEILEGAKDMISSGILQSPAPQAAIMIHLIPAIDLPAGTVIVPPSGVVAPAADYFTVTFTGKGCHGSSPAEGIDPISCAAFAITALQEIPARELSVSDNAVLTIGSVNAGHAANVIPDKAVIKGSLRTHIDTLRTRLKDRIDCICKYTAEAFRSQSSIVFDSGCPTLLNSAELCSFAADKLKQLLGSNRCFTAQQLNSSNKISLGGSEDFSYISHEIPTLMLALAAGEPKNGYKFSLHHPEVKFDTSVLPIGCAVFTDIAINWLNTAT